MARAAKFRSFLATFRERGVISSQQPSGRLFRNVTLIKSGLGNKADRHFYPAHVLKEAVDSGQFEKLKAYADHPSRVDETIQPERTIRDMVGLYRNVRFVREGERGGKVVGDLKIFRSHRWLSDLVDDLVASDAADKIGISINGAGDTEAKEIHEAGGRVNVNEVLNLRQLYSADIVTEAGAGGGFTALLESARAARERMPMKPTKKDLLAKIAEAAKTGDVAKVTSLTAQLAEATGSCKECGDSGMKKKKGMKEAEKKKAPKDEEAAEDPESVEEGASADSDADDRDADDRDADADDADVREAAQDDADDADETRDAAAGDDDQDIKVEDPADVKEARRSDASLRDRFHAATRTREAGMNAKGGASKGGGSFTKKAGSGGKQKGRRYAEADDVAETTDASEVESLRETVSDLKDENKQLRQRVAEAARKTAAVKIVRSVKGLSKDAQAALAGKLVRECRTVQEMEREVNFYTRLMEGAVDRVKDEFSGDDDDFGGVEGIPSRIREGYGGGGDTPEAFLEDLGLPVKHAAE